MEVALTAALLPWLDQSAVRKIAFVTLIAPERKPVVNQGIHRVPTARSGQLHPPEAEAICRLLFIMVAYLASTVSLLIFSMHKHFICCLSVCLSLSYIVSKCLNLSSKSFHRYPKHYSFL